MKKYIKSSKESAINSIDWTNLQNQLDKESEVGIDSILDKTESGLKLLSLLNSIEKESKLRIELLNEDGQDSVYIYKRYGDRKFLAYQNYLQFLEDIIRFILFSQNEEVFKKKCKKYLNNLIEEQKDEWL